MWKCKSCGRTKFEIERKIIKRDFDCKKNTINSNDIKERVWCCKCYNCGEDINDMAFWEEGRK